MEIMNDLEKAEALMASKKYRLADICKATGIPLNTLKSYSSGRIPLKTVAWERVYLLARYYEKVKE